MTVLEQASAVDKRSAPLYSQAEASRFLGLSASTYRNWARGYDYERGGKTITAAPVVTTVARETAHGPNIPFVGLAEGYALYAIRATGVPLQKIRPALAILDREVGMRHALASRRLFTDGAEVLFDYGEKSGGDERDALRGLTVVRDNQRVMADVVGSYLNRIEFGGDGLADQIPLLGFRSAEVVADVRRSFGQPTFERGGARLEDVLSLFVAERDVDVVAAEFGIPRSQLEDVLAVYVQAA